MNGGVGGSEEQWENFNATFKDTFGISYDEAKFLDRYDAKPEARRCRQLIVCLLYTSRCV